MTMQKPGVAAIDWMITKYSFITVPDDLAYKNVISVTEVTVPVKWSKWSGPGATKVEYLLDGVVHAVQNVVAVDGAQQGSIDLKFTKGGSFNLQVNLVNEAGSTISSNSQQLTIADTLGSHLAPLAMNVNASRFPCKMDNKQYQQNSGKVVSAYAIDWSVYRLHGMDYYVNNIPGDNLTHLFFCFLGIVGKNDSYKNINPTGYATALNVVTGLNDFEVFVPDPWAAYQKPVGTQVSSDAVKGCYGELMAFGKRYPNVKKIISIGGWTLSDPFFFMDVKANRDTFVASVEKYLRTWKFWDGIDLDWEFPGVGGSNKAIAKGTVDNTTYIALTKELRVMLDKLGAEFGKRYEMSIAINAVPDKLAPMNYGEIAKPVDFVNVMSYAFHGAWDGVNMSHHTNVYAPAFRKDEYTTQNYNCRREIDDLFAQGVPKSKMVLGAVTFGRGWAGVPDAPGTDVFLGKGVPGTHPGPQTEKDKYWLGVSLVMYSQIVAELTPENGWSHRYDEQAEAPFIYKKETGELLTYDNPRSVAKKCEIVMAEGLAGIFSWKMDTDNGDILNTMNSGMGNKLLGSIPTEPKPLTVSVTVNQTVNANKTVTLSASSDNPNNGTLAYVWKQTKGETVTLATSGVSGIQFTAPTLLAGDNLEFQVTVSDGKTAPVVKLVAVTVLADRAPTASAGVNVSVDSASAVTLLGTAVDADNNALSYTWSQVSGPTVTLSGATTLSATFVAPTVTVDTPLVFKLTVSDGVATAVTSQVTVTVKAKVTGGTNYPAYVVGKQYNSGDKVSYGGFDWQANYWTQNVAPSRSVGDWKLLTVGTLPWDGAVAYGGGELCTYNGFTWKASYWTKGDTPGVAPVWVKQ